MSNTLTMAMIYDNYNGNDSDKDNFNYYIHTQ